MRLDAAAVAALLLGAVVAGADEEEPPRLVAVETCPRWISMTLKDKQAYAHEVSVAAVDLALPLMSQLEEPVRDRFSAGTLRCYVQQEPETIRRLDQLCTSEVTPTLQQWRGAVRPAADSCLNRLLNEVIDEFGPPAPAA